MKLVDMSFERNDVFRWKTFTFFRTGNKYFKKKKFKAPIKITENSYKLSYRNFLKYRDKVDLFNEAQKNKLKRILDKSNQEKPKVLDLFCGCGGLSLGFENAGFNVFLAIDNDFSACETYSFNFKNSCVLCLDLADKEGNPYYLSKFLGINKLIFDIIIGGPPCQGFSIVGRPKIKSLLKDQVWDDPKLVEDDLRYKNDKHWFYNDPRNILYKKFLNYIAYFKPKLFLMENVPGMKSFQNGQVIDQIKLDFEDIGFSVQEKVLNSVNFRVPQTRKRLFFFGVNYQSKKSAKDRNNYIRLFKTNQKTIIPIKKFNDLFKFPSRTSDYIPLKNYNDIITVKDAISDLKDIRDFGEEIEYLNLKDTNPYRILLREKCLKNKVFNFVPRKTTTRDEKIYQFLDEGDKYKDLPEKITNYFYENKYHELSDEEINKLIEKTIVECMPYGNGKSFGDKFKRLKWNEPSWTVMAHLHKDGYMYIHPEQHRTISVREAARIQSFPDNFVFKSSRTNQFKQVGNAVPPLMSQVLAYHILDYLKKMKF